MKTICTLVAIAVAVTGLGAADTGSDSIQLNTRVLYLQGMDSREAVTLLRSQVQVRQMASFNDRDLVVVAGTAERVDASESLLREHDAILRVATPHEPVTLAVPDDSPLVSTVFRLTDDKSKAVVVLLRSIYRLRELSEFPQDNAVSVQATQPILDASEAMLRELRFLAAPIDEIRR